MNSTIRSPSPTSSLSTTRGSKTRRPYLSSSNELFFITFHLSVFTLHAIKKMGRAKRRCILNLNQYHIRTHSSIPHLGTSWAVRAPRRRLETDSSRLAAIRVQSSHIPRGLRVSLKVDAAICKCLAQSSKLSLSLRDMKHPIFRGILGRRIYLKTDAFVILVSSPRASRFVGSVCVRSTAQRRLARQEMGRWVKSYAKSVWLYLHWKIDRDQTFLNKMALTEFSVHIRLS